MGSDRLLSRLHIERWQPLPPNWHFRYQGAQVVLEMGICCIRSTHSCTSGALTEFIRVVTDAD